MPRDWFVSRHCLVDVPYRTGVMLGDSDTLLIEQGQASATPVYVTPSRPGMVEIYRDGQLINSQQVIAGLQALDTRVLPAGIYEVELRVLKMVKSPSGDVRRSTSR